MQESIWRLKCSLAANERGMQTCLTARFQLCDVSERVLRIGDETSCIAGLVRENTVLTHAGVKVQALLLSPGSLRLLR
jgi:hypothetical protein